MLDSFREPLAPLPFVLHTIVFLIGVGAVFAIKQRSATVLLRLQAIVLGVMYLTLGTVWGEGALLVVGGLLGVFGGGLLPFIAQRFGNAGRSALHSSVGAGRLLFPVILLGVLFLWFAVGQFAIFFPIFRESVFFVPFDLLALAAALRVMSRRDTDEVACLGGGFFIHGVLSFALPLAPFAPVLTLAISVCLMIVAALFTIFSGSFISPSSRR